MIIPKLYRRNPAQSDTQHVYSDTDTSGTTTTRFTDRLAVSDLGTTKPRGVDSRKLGFETTELPLACERFCELGCETFCGEALEEPVLLRGLLEVGVSRVEFGRLPISSVAEPRIESSQ